MLTFILDGLVRGPDLTGWKTSNLVVHLACGWLVFLLVVQLQRLFFRGQNPSHALPLVVAVLWLIHPLHVSTVLYTVQRMTLLSTLFQLLGIVSYLRARAAYLQGCDRRVLGWLSAALVALVLGVFSKETGILLVVYVLLVEALCLSSLQRGDLRSDRWAKRAMFGSLLFIGAMLCWLVLRSGSVVDGYSTRPFTWQERLLTQSRILVEYVRLTVVPDISEMKFIHDDIEISRDWFRPWITAPALIGLLFLAWSAWRVRRKSPIYTFGIGLFFIGHLIESSVVPLDLMYEHRQYLPSIGLLLAAAMAGMPLFTRRWLVIAVLVPLLSLLSVMTWTRAHAWSSEQSLFQEMVRINHESPRAMTMVANWYGNRGEITVARALLTHIASPAARLNALYFDCVEYGEVTGAQLTALPEPAILGFYEASGLMYLGRIGLAGNCRFPEEAYLVLLGRWMDRPIHAARSGLLIYRAYYLDRTGEHASALEALEEAYRVGGGRNPIALVIAAEISIDAGELQRAEKLLARARASGRSSGDNGDIEMAAMRLRLAREQPDKLVPFDPFQK
jgi:hypothetical protein